MSFSACADVCIAVRCQSAGTETHPAGDDVLYTEMEWSNA